MVEEKAYCLRDVWKLARLFAGLFSAWDMLDVLTFGYYGGGAEVAKSITRPKAWEDVVVG